MRFLFTILICCGFGISFSQPKSVENSPPKVVITTPTPASKLYWNSIIPYTIQVSDPEDGNSQYNEIPNNEVLLVIKYLPDSTKVKKYLLERSTANQQPLLWMSTSTCFNCHGAKTKLIGPSFDLVAQRYRGNSSAVDSLTNRIVKGSTGVWGDLKMPPHPQLTREQVNEIVRWILADSNDPDQTYLAGIEGAFRTKERPTSTKGVYVLTASYTDHGPKENSQANSTVRQGSKVGQQTIVLKNIE
jgi:cytochrome c